MHLSTRVFISATSGDLGSVRQSVKEALLEIDCHPVEQTNFPPDYRTVRDMLEEKIRSCQAVVHIVGDRYGAEPDPHKLPPGTPRRSYTQMEYDLARKLNKKLYVFLCATDFPYDPCDAEPADKQALQHAHRDALLADERLRTRVATRGELENKVRELQLELQQLRQQVRRYARYVGIGITLLVLVLGAIGYGVYRQTGQISQTRDQIAQVQSLYENPDQLAERMRANIRCRADEELQAARARGARWEEIRELERRRDVALDQADELIRTIQQGLAGKPDAIYREASRILAHEGVDAALGYLASHQQDILARVDRLAAREDTVRQKKQQALEPLLLQAELHETNLAWDRALELYETVAAKAPEWSRARRLLGAILVDLARYNEAEPHLQAALQRAHDNREQALATASLGNLYHDTAKWQQAEPSPAPPPPLTPQQAGGVLPTSALRVRITSHEHDAHDDGTVDQAAALGLEADAVEGGNRRGQYGGSKKQPWCPAVQRVHKTVGQQMQVVGNEDQHVRGDEANDRQAHPTAEAFRPGAELAHGVGGAFVIHRLLGDPLITHSSDGLSKMQTHKAGLVGLAAFDCNRFLPGELSRRHGAGDRIKQPVYSALADDTRGVSDRSGCGGLIAADARQVIEGPQSLRQVAVVDGTLVPLLVIGAVRVPVDEHHNAKLQDTQPQQHRDQPGGVRPGPQENQAERRQHNGDHRQQVVEQKGSPIQSGIVVVEAGGAVLPELIGWQGRIAFGASAGPQLLFEVGPEALAHAGLSLGAALPRALARWRLWLVEILAQQSCRL